MIVFIVFCVGFFCGVMCAGVGIALKAMDKEDLSVGPLGTYVFKSKMEYKFPKSAFTTKDNCRVVDTGKSQGRARR